MPDLTSNTATFRAGNYHYQGYLSSPPQNIVLSRAIAQSTFNETTTRLLFDDPYSGTGNTANVREGMTIRFYHQNTNILKGIRRVAANAIEPGSLINVDESSDNALDYADNDRFEVIDEYRVWNKLVSDDLAFKKDSRITYTDQTDLYAPVAIGGGGWVGFADTGAAIATVTFDASDSYATDPDSSGTLTYAWDVIDGTITVGTSSTAAITATFPVTFRHVLLTVTDASNSKTSTIAIPVNVHDTSTNPPIEVLMDTLSANVETGWSASFIVPDTDDSDVERLPDGAPIWYFERETYNGTVSSFGSNAPTDDRNHIKFMGYLNSDSLTYNADVNEVTFTAVSPLQRLADTGALPQILIDTASPSSWQEASDLTVAIMFWYLWTYGAALQHDILYLDARNFEQVRLAIQDDSSVLGQLRDIANSLNLVVTCDRLGRIYAVRDADYLDDADRNTRTTTYDLNTNDVIEITIPRAHHRLINNVRGEGVNADTNISNIDGFFSDAVGAPTTGTSRETIAKQILDQADPQTDLNKRTGHHYAKVNSLFADATTKAITLVPRDVRLVLPDGYDVFDPAYREYITLTLADGARGVAFTDEDRWTISALSVSYDHELGTKDVALTINHETRGNQGVDFVPATSTEAGLPSYTPPEFDVVPFVESTPIVSDQYFLTDANNKMALVGVTSGGNVSVFAFTSNFQTQNPTWTGTSLNPGGSTQSFALDANQLDSFWSASLTDINKLTDLFGVRAVTPQFNYGVALSAGRFDEVLIRNNIADTNVVTALLNYRYHPFPSSRLGVFVTTTTDGNTWSALTQLSTTAVGANSIALEVSPKNAAIQYAAYSVDTVTPLTFDLYRSTDTGATWSAVFSGLTQPIGVIHSVTDADGELYWFGTPDALYRSDTGTGTNYIAGLVDASSNQYGFQSAGSISTSPTDSNRMVIAVNTAQPSGTQFRVFVSDDGGSSWIEVPNPSNISWVRCITDGNVVYAFARSYHMAAANFNNLLSGGGLQLKYNNGLYLGRWIGIIGGGA